MKYFITYGDSKFQAAKDRICKQAMDTGEFDIVYSFGRENLSEALLQSDIIKIQRGGGLWSWKPDIIWKVINQAQIGDYIVYCDSGCSLYSSIEWNWYWRVLKDKDIIAQRLLQRVDYWTRRELIDFFCNNGKNWEKCYQYEATVILLVVSDFTKGLIKEWRDLMISKPELAMDVKEDEVVTQHKGFIENRHDQAVFSSLIYKSLNHVDNKDCVFSCWEKIEDFRLFPKQAIRATRLRFGEEETFSSKLISIIKRGIKHFLYVPLYYAPKQWWYSRQWR